MISIDYIKSKIRDVADFPKEGIIFKDITPLFLEPAIINKIVEEFEAFAKTLDVDVILGAESRGFLFAVPLSLKLNKPFVLVRKPNKLPGDVYSAEYTLEYGSSRVEIHKDALKPNQKVLIVDDLLATGGTVQAIEDLVRQAGCEVVGSTYLIKLDFLEGEKKLSGKVNALITY
ncbi:adenine phosphoribosyltransferase [Ureaplasma diversum]|uniref:Adenine phosphoribosyltransferase n=2 Tax=Ureaplasma diversum TaxID=42094 RepID=A0A084EXM1_9BACT|nr:adenine phosphoribosyltransferase [Ureaplasma diversum]AJQ45462.1 adenine phosphoribosyltransferase [Ureaplasma diversum]KEZ22713.1 Adenine phosphoribosyltransferase [Ureaplasma diversum NCTC 246]